MTEEFDPIPALSDREVLERLERTVEHVRQDTRTLVHKMRGFEELCELFSMFVSLVIMFVVVYKMGLTDGAKR